MHTSPPTPTSTLFPYTTLFRSRNTNLLNNPRSLENVVEMMPFIDLYDFLQRQNITQIDTIIVTQPAFIRSLQSLDRKSTRLNSSHVAISYAVFCLKKNKKNKLN